MPASNEPAHGARGYLILNPSNESGFNPFDPDLLGALREALAFIQAPQSSCTSIIDGSRCTFAVYDTTHTDRLAEMMRLAIRKGEGRV